MYYLLHVVNKLLQTTFKNIMLTSLHYNILPNVSTKSVIYLNIKTVCYLAHYRVINLPRLL
jgi:hypothetical protein